MVQPPSETATGRTDAASVALGEALAGFEIFFFGNGLMPTASAGAAARIAVAGTLDPGVGSIAVVAASGFAPAGDIGAPMAGESEGAPCD